MIYVYALKNFNHNYMVRRKNVLVRFHQHTNGEEKNTWHYAPFELIFSMECNAG